MVTLILVVIFPYLIFIFLAESVNPLFKPRYPLARPRWKVARSVAIAAVLGGSSVVMLHYTAGLGWVSMLAIDGVISALLATFLLRGKIWGLLLR